jgi:hypothetical protein
VELIHHAALEEIDQLPGDVLRIVGVQLMPLLLAYVVQHASEHFEVGRFYDLGMHPAPQRLGETAIRSQRPRAMTKPDDV